MGYRPLVALCIPLTDLHHFCLTKQCHLANRNAICILYQSDYAWLCCLLSQYKELVLNDI